jgi:hypothetical protein
VRLRVWTTLAAENRPKEMMAPLAADSARPPVRTSWLDGPLSTSSCVIGWIVAAAVFVGVAALLGGPAEGDAAESLYSTWAIAHGHIACAIPPITTYHIPPIARPVAFAAPLWPLISGAFDALIRIGHNVPFPSQSALGPHCSTGLAAMYKWSVQSGAALPTVRIGYLSWFVLMGGVVAMLRTSGRGRCRWEPLVLVLMACVPPVLAALLDYFHPQDIVAVGLVLGGLACARRGCWIWAGILVGLAFTSQQFALLAIAPLFVLAPKGRQTRFAGAALVTAAVVLLPVVALTSGRALSASLLGTGNSSGYGGTLLWEIHPHGLILVILSRIVPIGVSMLLSRWALRRLGSAVMDPVPLLSLIATSFSLRLVFEQNLYGYYFMALAVSLVLLDVVGGRIRGQLVAWFGLLTLAFDPVPWGYLSNGQLWGLDVRVYLPIVFMGIAALFIATDAIRGRIRWYPVAWLIIAILAFAKLPPWAVEPMRGTLPNWFWQMVLLPTGIVLAAGPLISYRRHRDPPDLDPAIPGLTMASASSVEVRDN